MLLKVNQVGTFSEAYNAGMLAKANHYGVTLSLRSSDTNDSFIADLAVGLGAEQIKLGSPVRGERNAKYNRLLTIEQELEVLGRFVPELATLVVPVQESACTSDLDLLSWGCVLGLNLVQCGPDEFCFLARKCIWN